MKKFTLFIVSFLFPSCNLFAQGNYTPFPEDSAQWSIWNWSFDSTSGQSLGIVSFQLKMKGDTNLNGIVYNKIYKGYDLAYNSTNDSLHCFMRQDTAQRKVWVRYPYYLYNDSTDILLYDYSLQVGDTFTLKIISSGNSYKMQLLTIVDSVAYNNNFYLREFGFVLLPPPGVLWGNSCEGFCFGWTELFGSSCNLLYTEIPEEYCLYHDFFTQCIWYKGQYPFGGINCDLNTTISEIASSHEILQIIPNPVLSTAEIIVVKSINIEEVKVFNCYGMLVNQLKPKKSNKWFLDTHNMVSGLYFVSATTDKQQMLKQKFVVVK